MGHPGAWATLIAQLLGAQSLGVLHNHCATTALPRVCAARRATVKRAFWVLFRA